MLHASHPSECAQCAFWVRLLIWATRKARV
jgi:hypothetical protein